MKVLSSEETKELFQKMKDGDEQAREDLINGNLKLVLSILKKLKKKAYLMHLLDNFKDKGKKIFFNEVR